MRRNNNFFKAFLLSVCFMITAFGLNALTAHAYSEGETDDCYKATGIGAQEGLKYTSDEDWVPKNLEKKAIQGENLSDDKSILYLIMADGFTADEKDAFEKEASDMMNYLMKLVPYSEFKNLTKAYTVFTPSNESGASRDLSYADYMAQYKAEKEKGEQGNVEIDTKDTFFKCAFNQLSAYYNYDYERLIEPSCAGMQRAADIAKEYAPSYNQIIIISNSERYGGSGLSEQWGPYRPYYPTTTQSSDTPAKDETYFQEVKGINLAVASINSASKEVAAHEIAHALGNLADEYWPGEVFATENCPNMTQTSDASQVKWKDFLTYSERTKNGVFQYEGYSDAAANSWYRPSKGSCKMEALSYPNSGIFYEFCEVCREGFRENMSKASNSTSIYWQDYCKNSTPSTAKTIAADGTLEYSTLDQSGYTTEFAYTGNAPKDLESSFIVRHAGTVVDNPKITFTYYDSKKNKLDKAPSASGTYTVTAAFAGSGDMNSCTVTKAYTILKDTNQQKPPQQPEIAAPKTMTLSASAYTYNGKVRKPSVTIKDTNGKAVGASNYTVSYSKGCKNVGRYTVTVTFKGDYSKYKSMSKTFDIKPKTTSISKLKASKKAFTVKWKKQTTQTTGYHIQYSKDKKFKNGVKAANVKSSKTLKKISKLKSKKTYYVRIRTYKTVKVNGKSVKVYSNWSKIKKVKTK